MKLQILIESEKPLLILSDRIDRNKKIAVYRSGHGASTAQRAYLRTLRTPQTAQELAACWRLLADYAGIAEKR